MYALSDRWSATLTKNVLNDLPAVSFLVETCLLQQCPRYMLLNILEFISKNRGSSLS